MPATAVSRGARPRRVGLLAVHGSPLEQAGSGDSGGMSVAVSTLAARLAEAGSVVDVFTRAAGADLPRTVRMTRGVRVHHIRAGAVSPRRLDAPADLRTFVLGLAAHPAVTDLDLLHAHGWASGWVGRQAARRLDLPLVQTFRALARAGDGLGDGDGPRQRVAAEERVVAAADALLAATPREAAVLRERYGAVPGRVHLVEPGVDLDVFQPGPDPPGARLAARRSLGGGRIVLFVGRLHPRNAPDTAVRVLAALDRHLPDGGEFTPTPTRLVIVGGPSGSGFGTVDPSRLRALAAELGVADRVAVLAPRPPPDLVALYQAADAVLVPGRAATRGLVALEAQACGTPVVASESDGLRHALGEAGGGTVVERHDPDAFARALVPYLVDAGRRATAGEAGRRWAARFDARRAAAATQLVYDAVIDARAAATTGAVGVDGPEP